MPFFDASPKSVRIVKIDSSRLTAYSTYCPLPTLMTCWPPLVSILAVPLMTCWTAVSRSARCFSLSGLLRSSDFFACAAAGSRSLGTSAAWAGICKVETASAVTATPVRTRRVRRFISFSCVLGHAKFGDEVTFTENPQDVNPQMVRNGAFLGMCMDRLRSLHGQTTGWLGCIYG